MTRANVTKRPSLDVSWSGKESANVSALSQNVLCQTGGTHTQQHNTTRASSEFHQVVVYEYVRHFVFCGKRSSGTTRLSFAPWPPKIVLRLELTRPANTKFTKKKIVTGYQPRQAKQLLWSVNTPPEQENFLPVLPPTISNHRHHALPRICRTSPDGVLLSSQYRLR